VSIEKDPKDIFRNTMSAYLCPICIERFKPLKSPMCPRCGFMFKSREGADHLCGECLEAGSSFGIARAVGVYEQALMVVVHDLKYGEKVQLAYPLSQLLISVFLKYWQDRPIDIITPVPLYAKRFRTRGFNQAYLIIRYWTDLLLDTHPIPTQIRIERSLLSRKRPTRPQTGLGRKERLWNVKGAFRLQEADLIKDKAILLVDDVYTTGATAGECAKILLDGGASQVDILTLARAM
jgi:ComF family protein